MRIGSLSTPALLIDASALKQNIETMASLCGSRLRPHYKSHKCRRIAEMQLATGAKGFTCATLGEVSDLIGGGVGGGNLDILLANQLPDIERVRRLAYLSKSARLTVCVDKDEDIELYAEAMASEGGLLGVYVEFDTGMGRMGVERISEVCRLAERVGNTRGLSFRGIQAYAGQLSHVHSREERRAEVAALSERLLELKRELMRRGINVSEISGGSTGTVEFKCRDGLYTELQCGTYALGDASYAKCELPFKQALYLYTSVLGVRGSRVITDAGVKSCGVDQGMPVVYGHETTAIELHEEHGLLDFADTPRLKLGNRLAYIPGHCCTTMNLHDFAYLVEDGEVVERLEISARGYKTQDPKSRPKTAHKLRR